MDKLQRIEAFVRVAQTSSYAEAARLIGVSKSVVSTRIQQLELSIGTPLLVRNTRSVGSSNSNFSSKVWRRVPTTIRLGTSR